MDRYIVESTTDGRRRTTDLMTKDQAKREAASQARNPTVEQVKITKL